jgi:hypothetical protein
MSTKFTTITLIVLVFLTTISVTIKPSLIDDSCDKCAQLAASAGDLLDVQFSGFTSDKEFYAYFSGITVRSKK